MRDEDIRKMKEMKTIQEMEALCRYHRSIGNNITADIIADALELLKERANDGRAGAEAGAF